MFKLIRQNSNGSVFSPKCRKREKREESRENEGQRFISRIEYAEDIRIFRFGSYELEEETLVQMFAA